MIFVIDTISWNKKKNYILTSRFQAYKIQVPVQEIRKISCGIDLLKHFLYVLKIN